MPDALSDAAAEVREAQRQRIRAWIWRVVVFGSFAWWCAVATIIWWIWH